jgi:hypothetical protein
MIERTYNPQTGAVVPSCGTQASQQIYDVRGQRAAQPPGDQPQPDAHVPGPYQDQWFGKWSPSASPDDPHETPFEVGDGAPETGPVPPNIVV